MRLAIVFDPGFPSLFAGYVQAIVFWFGQDDKLLFTEEIKGAAVYEEWKVRHMSPKLPEDMSSLGIP